MSSSFGGPGDYTTMTPAPGQPGGTTGQQPPIKRGKPVGLIAVIVIAAVACAAGIVVLVVLLTSGKGAVNLTYSQVGSATYSPYDLATDAEYIGKMLRILGIDGFTVEVEGDHVAIKVGSREDADRVKTLMDRTGMLEFRIVQESKDADAVKNDPAWKVSAGEDFKPDKVIVLPAPETAKSGPAQLLKLGPALLTGDAVAKAKVMEDSSGAPRIAFELTGEGASQFAKITGQNKGKQLAIVLDYEVMSAPNINEPITQGSGEITGKFTQEEAAEIAAVLSTGFLPVPLELTGEEEL